MKLKANLGVGVPLISFHRFVETIKGKKVKTPSTTQQE